MFSSIVPLITVYLKVRVAKQMKFFDFIVYVHALRRC